MSVDDVGAGSSGASSDPEWLRYETSVREMLACLDPAAEVLHDVQIFGKMSMVSRQVDVWVKGSLVGIEILVAVECKRRKRPINVEVIDQFVGKLLDVGADRGIMYSYSGFTETACLRAFHARNPHVMAITLQDFPNVPVYESVMEHAVSVEIEFGPSGPLWADDVDGFGFLHFFKSGEWPEGWE